MNETIGVYELAKELGVSHQTIYNWTSDKNLPHTYEYLGTRKVLKYDLEECKQWLNNRR